MAPETPISNRGVTGERLKALVDTACRLLSRGVPDVDANQLHRLDKADTRGGVESIKNCAGMGIPYAMLLYERFLGRPFAGHRDSVSELVGDSLESAIEEVLTEPGSVTVKQNVRNVLKALIRHLILWCRASLIPRSSLRRKYRG